jgi:hypothetical protein
MQAGRRHAVEVEEGGHSRNSMAKYRMLLRAIARGIEPGRERRITLSLIRPTRCEQDLTKTTRWAVCRQIGRR